LGASFALNSGTPFPGSSALLPCIGAAMLIWPRLAPSLAASALSIKPAQFIGKISYSLYLWHWPLIVYFRHLNMEQMPDLTLAIALLAGCILLSAISWRFIEKPFRRLKSGSPRRSV